MKRQANSNKKTKKFKNAHIVTGASGFLGSHLCEHFMSQGDVVIGLDNFCTGTRKNIPYLTKKSKTIPENPFHFIKHDVSTPWPQKKIQAILKKTKTKLKFVFHFASPASPPLYQKLAKQTLWVNSLGTEQALQTADHHKARVIFASTSEVYGDPEVHPQPETYWGNVNPCGIRSCYDEAKRFGEALIFHHNRQKKTKHGWVRIFNTYGPRMNPFDGRVVINFLMQGLKKQNLTVYGDGSQTRSFCFVSDLIRGIVAYAEKGSTIPINLGNPHEFTVLQLALIVQKMDFEKTPEITFLEAAADDPQKRKPIIEKAKQELQWEPIVSLEQGLQQTLAWLRQNLRY